MMQDQDSKSQSDEKSSNGSLVNFICVLHWLYIKIFDEHNKYKLW